MLKKMTMLGVLLFALAACGPKSLPPIVEQGVVNEEARRQQELVVKDYMGRVQRVESIGYRLLRDNVDACGDMMQGRIGAAIYRSGDVARPYRDAVAFFWGIKDDVAKVVSVAPESPAESAGLKIGDEVVALNGRPMSWTNTLYVASFRGDPVRITVVRDGKQEEIAVSPVRTCRFLLEMKEDPVINAFANGDMIMVNSGLVKFTRTDDELALVLGHELAHNTMQHIDAKRNNAMIGTLILDLPIALLTRVNPGVGNAAGAGAFSSDFETEADYVGLYYTAKAGYGIRDVSELWRRMAIENPGAIYTTSTHPTTANRFVVLEAARQEIEAKKANGQPLEPNMKQRQ